MARSPATRRPPRSARPRRPTSGTTRVPSWLFGRATTNAPPNDLSLPRKSGFATAMYVLCSPGGAGELLRRERVVGVRDPERIEIVEACRLPVELRPRARERVAVEQPERDRRRDEAGKDDAGEEERGKPEAQRAQHEPIR